MRRRLRAQSYFLGIGERRQRTADRLHVTDLDPGFMPGCLVILCVPSNWHRKAIASAQVPRQQKLKAEKLYVSLHTNDQIFVRLVVIIDLYVCTPYNTVVRRKTLPKNHIYKLPAPQITKDISLRTPHPPSSHCAPFLSFQVP